MSNQPEVDVEFQIRKIGIPPIEYITGVHGFEGISVIPKIGRISIYRALFKKNKPVCNYLRRPKMRDISSSQLALHHRHLWEMLVSQNIECYGVSFLRTGGPECHGWVILFGNRKLTIADTISGPLGIECFIYVVIEEDDKIIFGRRWNNTNWVEHHTKRCQIYDILYTELMMGTLV